MKRLLIVDDDAVVTTVYARHFRAAGFEVRVARTGEDGLAAVQDFLPDAVLLDLNMPGANGVQWLAEVRSDPRFAHLPVLVFTAGTVDWQVWAASHSAVPLLFKQGAAPGDVIRAVNAIIDRAAAPPPAGSGVVRVFGRTPPRP